MKNRVKISIDGKSFTLVGEESEEHIRVWRLILCKIDGSP